MGDVQTASTLTFVAGILQIVFSVIYLVFWIFLMGILLIPFIYDPYYALIFGSIFFVLLLVLGIFGIFGLIFGIIWLNWRHYPSEHKTGLIVSGILALLFSMGFIPGILALVAGAIAPTPSEYRGYELVRPPTIRAITHCPRCGADIAREDQFCWRCGTQL
jgi:membrane protease YdiL (CAAX protease family)